MAIMDILRNSELFGDLEIARLQKVSVYCRGVSYREGMTVFKEGDEATELYVLTDGMVALEMDVSPVPNRPAIPTAVEVVTKGESFGWSAVVEPHVYTLSARCMTHCTALAIKGDLFRKVMVDDTDLGFQVMKYLARLISLRLMHTRLRLTNGLGLILQTKELGYE